MYLRTLPFSQVNAIKGTVTLRHDKQIYLSIDRNSLQEPNVHKVWGGLKLDYIFDNTISRELIYIMVHAIRFLQNIINKLIKIKPICLL